MGSAVPESTVAERMFADRYRIEGLIGAGGMAAVWAGRDLRLDRPVAIKELAGEGLRQPMALERFDREARAVGRLSHPNVVSVHDVGLQDGQPYLVMELVDGPTVAKLLVGGPLPVADVLSIGSQVCAGLAAAHTAGIVHRDIKPGNLIIAAAGVVKICDFGVARLLDASANPNLTGPATVWGSPRYMAPEQINGEPIDSRADLYALGCTLYAMFAGAPPFTEGGTLGILHQHVTQTPEPLRVRRPEVPPQIEALVAELLAKRPDERPPDADAVRARIVAVQADPVLAAARLGLLRSAVPPAMRAVATHASLPDEMPRPRGRSNERSRRSTATLRRWPVAAAAAIAIAVAAATTALATLQPRTAHGAGQFITSSGAPAMSPPPTAHASPTTAHSTGSAPSAKPHTHPAPSAMTSSRPPTDPVTALRQAIAQQVATGGLQANVATDLNHMVDDLAHTIATGNTGDITNKINALRAKLTSLIKARQLTDDGYQLLTTAVDLVAVNQPTPAKSS